MHFEKAVWWGKAASKASWSVFRSYIVWVYLIYSIAGILLWLGNLHCLVASDFKANYMWCWLTLAILAFLMIYSRTLCIFISCRILLSWVLTNWLLVNSCAFHIMHTALSRTQLCELVTDLLFRDQYPRTATLSVRSRKSLYRLLIVLDWIALRLVILQILWTLIISSKEVFAFCALFCRRHSVIKQN